MPLFSVNTMFSGGIISKKKAPAVEPPVEFDTFYNFGNVVTRTGTSVPVNYRFSLRKNTQWNPDDLNSGIFRFTLDNYAANYFYVDGMSCGFSNGTSLYNYNHTPVRITFNNGDNTVYVNQEIVSDEIDLSDHLDEVSQCTYFLYHIFINQSPSYLPRFNNGAYNGYRRYTSQDQTLEQNIGGYSSVGGLYQPCQLIEEG